MKRFNVSSSSSSSSYSSYVEPMDTADGDAVVVSDSDSSGSTNKFAGTESEATRPSSNRSGVTVDFELAYEIAQRELCHSCT